MSSHAHLVAGVLISILSAVFYNVGFVVEKQALSGLPPVHARRIVHLVRTVASSPLWLLGFVAMLGGLALQVVALSLVSISVVQPIFVSGIVLLLVLSHVTLHERLGRRERGAVILVAVALLAISLSLDASSDRAGSNGALRSLILAAVPTVAVACFLFVLAGRAGSGRGRLALPALLFGASSGLTYGVAALATKAVAAEIQRYGVVASIPHVVSSAYLYTLILTSGLGLLLFQTGLQRCPASVVVPVSNLISSTYVVAVGTVIFDEQLPGVAWKLALRIIGFAGVLVSVLLLVNARTDEPELPLIGDPVVAPVASAEPPPLPSGAAE